MTDTPESKTSDAGSENTASKDQVHAKSLPIQIHMQYVKDISFENPNAPQTLQARQSGPEMDININLDASRIDTKDHKGLYECVLILSATAKQDGKTVFLAEVQYGAVVSLEAISEDQHHPVLLIEVPRVIFPFARQILADLTVSGGYPPLLLNPVDFQAMYLDRFKDEIQKKDIESNNEKSSEDSEKKPEKDTKKDTQDKK